jgi:hypothetical protein
MDVPAQLPHCPDDHEAKDWSQTEPWKLDGQTVTVRGPLVVSTRRVPGGTLTSGLCGTQAGHAPVVIGGLYQELAIESLRCRGDDSPLRAA